MTETPLKLIHCWRKLSLRNWSMMVRCNERNIAKEFLRVLYCIVVDINMVVSDTFSEYPVRTKRYNTNDRHLKVKKCVAP